MQFMQHPLIILSLAYLVGSVNFSILLFILLGKGDPRKSYSGNAGATNVYRQVGLFWAALVLLLDFGRAILVAFISLKYLNNYWITWAGFCLILGNTYPVFHAFNGGKGVANYLGFSTVLNPLFSAIAALVWVSTKTLAKQSFIASFALIFVLTIGIVLRFENDISGIIGAWCTFLFIICNHRSNISNFLKQLADPGK